MTSIHYLGLKRASGWDWWRRGIPNGQALEPSRLLERLAESRP